MAAYLPAYKDTQKVNEAAMSADTIGVNTGNASGFNWVDKPVIASGCEVSVLASTANVTAGYFIGDAWDSSDSVVLPATPQNVMNNVVATPVDLSSLTPTNWAWLVARETSTDVTYPTKPGTIDAAVSIDVTLELVIGGPGAYPVSRTAHDTILCGIKAAAGPVYTVDYAESNTRGFASQIAGKEGANLIGTTGETAQALLATLKTYINAPGNRLGAWATGITQTGTQPAGAIWVNIASVANPGTGVYNVTFTSPLPTANYEVSITVSEANTGGPSEVPTVYVPLGNKTQNGFTYRIWSVNDGNEGKPADGRISGLSVRY